MSIQIIESNDIPDSTYFRTGAVEPEINTDGTITIYDGQGSRRSSWGAPGVTSTVVFESLDIIAIHVGFHHKHGGGQFWRYFQINGVVRQVAWKDLDDDTRLAILEAAERRAPSWAKSPGKLRSQYKPANPKANAFVGYKVVEVAGEGFTSLYDDTPYELGRTKVQKSERNHGGGWYVYEGDVKTRFLSGDIVGNPRPGLYAILECECWGNREYYSRSGEWIHPEYIGYYDVIKTAVTYCKPLEVIEYLEI